MDSLKSEAQARHKLSGLFIRFRGDGCHPLNAQLNKRVIQYSPYISRRGPSWGRGYESDFNISLTIIVENGNPHYITVI